jgi:arginine N-succinyltransferase
MPKQPIYVNLLSQTARDVIGKPNDKGRAALAMLEKEGFLWRGQIDIFDGAPSVDTFIDHIETIRSSSTAKIAGHVSSSDDTQYLVCGGDIGSFAACISTLEISSDGDVLLPAETLSGLGLSVGGCVRYVAL